MRNSVFKAFSKSAFLRPKVGGTSAKASAPGTFTANATGTPAASATMLPAFKKFRREVDIVEVLQKLSLQKRWAVYFFWLEVATKILLLLQRDSMAVPSPFRN